MGRTAPIDWGDFTDEVRHKAIGAIVGRYMVSREHAVDLLNEAEQRLVKRRTVPRDVQSLLRTTMQNLLINEMRRSKREELLFHVADRDHNYVDYDGRPTKRNVEPFHEVTPVTTLEERERQARLDGKVQAALDKLPERDRLLLTGYYFEGRPMHAFDRELELAPGVSKSVALRARQRMRRILVDNGVTADDVG